MAVSFVGSSGTTSATGTVPAGHAAGDLIIALCVNSGATPTPVPSGWTSLGSSGAGTGLPIQVGYKFAASSSETTGTWTPASGAQVTIFFVYRGAGAPSVAAFNTATSATVTFPALTLSSLAGGSWVLRAGYHLAASNFYNSPPTGLTARTAIFGGEGGFDTNAGVTANAASVSTAALNASGLYSAATLEIPVLIAAAVSPTNFFEMF